MLTFAARGPSATAEMLIIKTILSRYYPSPLLSSSLPFSSLLPSSIQRLLTAAKTGKKTVINQPPPSSTHQLGLSSLKLPDLPRSPLPRLQEGSLAAGHTQEGSLAAGRTQEGFQTTDPIQEGSLATVRTQVVPRKVEQFCHMGTTEQAACFDRAFARLVLRIAGKTRTGQFGTARRTTTCRW